MHDWAVSREGLEHAASRTAGSILVFESSQATLTICEYNGKCCGHAVASTPVGGAVLGRRQSGDVAGLLPEQCSGDAAPGRSHNRSGRCADARGRLCRLRGDCRRRNCLRARNAVPGGIADFTIAPDCGRWRSVGWTAGLTASPYALLGSCLLVFVPRLAWIDTVWDSTSGCLTKRPIAFLYPGFLFSAGMDGLMGPFRAPRTGVHINSWHLTGQAVYGGL